MSALAAVLCFKFYQNSSIQLANCTVLQWFYYHQPNAFSPNVQYYSVHGTPNREWTLLNLIQLLLLLLLITYTYLFVTECDYFT